MKKTILITTICILLLTSCFYKTKVDSDYLKWLNTSNALFIEFNKGNFKYYGGYKVNSKSKKLARNYLEKNFDIKSSVDLIDSIALLKSGNTNEMFKNHKLYLDNYEKTNISNSNLDKSKNDWVVSTYEKYGENAILGFDLSRGMMLISMGYLAEYFTEEKAMEYSLGFAKKIQNNFNSWSDFNNSYLNGLFYISTTKDEKNIYLEFVEIEKELDSDEKVSIIDFNTNLSSEYNELGK